MLTAFSHRWVKLRARPCFTDQLGCGTLLAAHRSHHPKELPWWASTATLHTHFGFVAHFVSHRKLCSQRLCSIVPGFELQLHRCSSAISVFSYWEKKKLLSSFVTCQTVSETEMAKAPVVGWSRIPFGKEIPTQFSASEKTSTVPNIVNISTR